MPKSLGQIHSVDYYLQNSAAGDQGLIDLPGQLSNQLQHRVRMMSTFKVVGIDIAIIGSGTSTVSGDIAYYASTKGRVEALQHAWQACKDMMKLNGVKYWNNLNYDFRPIMRDPAFFTLTGALGSDFGNQASLESVGGTPGPLCLTDPPAGYKSVFETYNEGIQPTQTAAVDFSSGFNVIEAGTAGDMVLNEAEYINAWVPVASPDPERIPFQLSIDTANDEASTTFLWRPDPALYLSVLTGQLHVDIDISSDTSVDLRFTVHVAGWKSILGSNKKRRYSKRQKSHGRKRRSKQ